MDRRTVLNLIGILMILLLPGRAQAREIVRVFNPLTGTLCDAVKDEFVVLYDESTFSAQNLSALSAIGAQTVSGSRIGNRPIELIRVSSGPSGGLTAQSTLSFLESQPGILAVEPNYVFYADLSPNDPKYTDNSQYYLYQSGNPAGDIDAPDGWNHYTGNDTVVVAVIDSGLDLDHPDWPASRLLYNTAEVLNGIDDDNNGYVDDLLSMDFWDYDTDVQDAGGGAIDGHGSHSAGLIGAATNNAVGMAGVCWSVKILPVKIFGSGNSTDLHKILSALYYAYNRGVDVVNMSLGGPIESKLLDDALQAGWDQGILLVASAGNYGVSTRYNPASNGNVIGVGSVNASNNRSSFSNYAQSTNDLTWQNLIVTCYGESILSTNYSGGYTSANGTSFSAPIVSGMVALARGYYPNLTNRQIYDLIVASADDLGSAGVDVYYGYGRPSMAHLFKQFGSDQLDELVLSVPAAFNQGQAVSVTVTAKDGGSNVNSFTRCSFEVDTGTVSPRWSGEFSSGSWTGAVTINSVGTTVLTVRYADVIDTAVLFGTHQTGNIGSFQVQAPPAVVWGETFTVTITAQDSYANVDTTFAGSVTYASNDTGSGSTVRAEAASGFVNGVLTTGLSLREAGAITIVVANAGDASDTGYAVVLCRTRIDTMTVPSFDDFESDSWRWDNGTFTPALATRWERGSPSGFPASGAYSGNAVWATNLDGNYEAGMNIQLYTPALDLRGCSLPRVELMYALDGEADRDGGYFEVSSDGGRSWLRLPDAAVARPHLSDWRGYDYGSINNQLIFRDEFSYRLVRLTLDDYAGTVVVLRMGFESDGANNYPGWVLDDFRLYEKPDTFTVEALDYAPWANTTTLQITALNASGETETRFNSRLFLMSDAPNITGPDSTPFFSGGTASFVVVYDSTTADTIHYGDSERGTRDAWLRIGEWNDGVFVRAIALGRESDSNSGIHVIITDGSSETLVLTNSSGIALITGVANGSWTVIARDSGALEDSIHGVVVAGGLTDSSPIRLVLINGDANGDGAVNDFDLSRILSRFGESGAVYPECDLNRDGVVNLPDVLIQMEFFGRYKD